MKRNKVTSGSGISRTLAAGAILYLAALLPDPALALNFKNGTAWNTTDSMNGMQELCIAINVGNTTLVMINRHGQVLTPDQLSSQNINDCTRGIEIAHKKHKIFHFSPSDMNAKQESRNEN